MTKFINDDTRSKIVELFNTADYETRDDPPGGEDAYLFNLTKTLRKKFNDSPFTGYTIYTVKIEEDSERKFGTDGIIIFENQELNTVKVGMFEAKWLISTDGKFRNSWDNKIKKKPFSRFTEELIKQLKIPSQIALFTMLQSFESLESENKDFPKFNPTGTTNVWSKTVLDYALKQDNRSRFLTGEYWKKKDAQFLVNDGCSLGEIVNEILLCNQGKQIPINKVNDKDRVDTRYVQVKEKQNKLLIPIPDIGISKTYHNYNYKKLERWMIENGLSSYIHIETGHRKKD
jgi:hypothetical protein